MKKTSLTLSALLLGLSAFAQTDLIYPWVTNNASFRGTIVVNNPNGSAADVTLTAQRQATASEATLTQTVTQSIDAFGQLVITANELFPALGDGSAFMVRLTSESSNINGGFVNVGTLSQSQTSPSQANVIQASEAGSTWLFNYMFIGGGFSAPVLINLGSTDVDVTLYAFQNGQRVGETTLSVPAGHPATNTTANLFPELTGDMYLVAHADGGQLVGTAFIFNEFEFLEPSMANAVALSEVPNPEGGGSEQVSFASQIQPMFTSSCGGGSCHLNGSSQQGLALDAGVSYNNIVNRRASLGGLNLIEPGSPDDSYLYQKLLPPSQASYFGDRMPRLATPWNEEQLTLLRDWISQGAQNN